MVSILLEGNATFYLKLNHQMYIGEITGKLRFVFFLWLLQKKKKSVDAVLSCPLFTDRLIDIHYVKVL